MDELEETPSAGQGRAQPNTGYGRGAASRRSSLSLLESLIQVGNSPEKLPDFCEDWADNPEQVRKLGRFDSVLNTLYQAQSETPDSGTDLAEHGDMTDRSADPYLSMCIGTDCIVTQIGEDAADILGVAVGDDIDDLLTEALRLICMDSLARGEAGCFTDILARDGSRHLAHVTAILTQDAQIHAFEICLCKQTLPQAALSYMRHKLQLTNAELDIVALLLRRYDLQAIADRRNSTLNTARTHVNNIKRKFKSRRLSDVILSVQEIISSHQIVDGPVRDYSDRYMPVRRNTKILALGDDGRQMEYERYGDTHDRPLVLLHSMEYGLAPPPAFVNQALAQGYCLYIPLRPGFGHSTPVTSQADAVGMLEEFMAALSLDEITLVGCSTGAPVAIHLNAASARVARLFLVNYGFNMKDKISVIKPAWVRGLLQLAMRSREASKYALSLTQRLIKTIGAKRFYQKLYDHCPEDLVFVENNPATIAAASELILSVSLPAIRRDVIEAFTPNPELAELLEGHDNIFGIFGERTHGLAAEIARESAAEFMVPLDVIHGGGRNCIYLHPEAFFDILSACDVSVGERRQMQPSG